MWSAIKEVLCKMKNHIQWVVGNGNNINIWDNLWIGDSTLRDHIIGSPGLHSVCQLIFEGRWHLPADITNFLSHFKLDINSVPIDDNNENCCFWLPDLKVKFSAHNAYNWIRDCKHVVWWHKWIWGSSILPKVSKICWRIMNRAVPTDTDSTLQSKGISMISICYLRKNGADSLEYLFWDCAYDSNIRDWCFSLFQIDITVGRSVSSFKLMLALCASQKNNVLFNDMHPDLRKIISIFREGVQISKATMYNNVHELSIQHTIGVQCRQKDPSSTLSCYWIPPGIYEILISCDGCSLECVTILDDLHHAASFGFLNIWITTDSSSACAAFNSDSLPWILQLQWNKLNMLFARIKITAG
ncbi:hypothetical protein GIB67_018779 [Kingdonia uniflora]|uniref:Reverse transcriptase zinc-binding domain-containing protein n=1 Tax=Kingdonia uniflora TaxID=39325 RepID=A0A7J7NDT0_9MAGN|nr:hypothetical protein GIB67_018779 [Kingdonia uniflora]